MNAILENLDSLSSLDKRKLRDLLDVELSHGKGNFTDEEIAVWNALTHVIHVRMSLDTFLTRTKYGKRTYADDVFQIHQFMNDSCGRLTKIEQMSVLATIMRCMVLYVTSGIERHVTPKEVLENIYLIDQAVDDQYPGY